MKNMLLIAAAALTLTGTASTADTYEVWTVQSQGRVFTDAVGQPGDYWLVNTNDVMQKVRGSNRPYDKDYLSEALGAVLVEPGQTFAEAIVANTPVVSEWDYFWGTTLNPKNTGWNDFWYQCQDENKTAGDCIGTIAVGITAVVALPILAGAALVATPVVGSVATVAAAPASVAIGASITDAQQTQKEF